jgi:hypothetical protein
VGHVQNASYSLNVPSAVKRLSATTITLITNLSLTVPFMRAVLVHVSTVVHALMCSIQQLAIMTSDAAVRSAGKEPIAMNLVRCAPVTDV